MDWAPHGSQKVLGEFIAGFGQREWAPLWLPENYVWITTTLTTQLTIIMHINYLVFLIATYEVERNEEHGGRVRKIQVLEFKVRPC